MSSSYEEQQKEEIKEILKAIYDKYHKFSAFSFYYKLRGGEIDVITENYEKGEYTRHAGVLLDPRLEYALFILLADTIVPSFDCINFNEILEALGQLILIFGDLALFHFTKLITSLVKKSFGVYYRDPLSQVLMYRRILPDGSLQHVYYCLSVLLVEPSEPDVTSIFHGKEGIVAYCISLSDAIHLRLYSHDVNISLRRFEELRNRVLMKLKRFPRGKRKEEYCNIDAIANFIHNEIEEYNELMRQYHVLRIAFPLY